MTKKQSLILFTCVASLSIAIGIASLFTDQAIWAGVTIGYAIAYVGGGGVLLFGIIKLVRVLTSEKTTPEKRQWTINRLLLIAAFVTVTFIISYFRTH